MTAPDTLTLQKIDASTRQAIQDSFPMGFIMKHGSDNPLTIHSADPILFRAMYALIAETLSVSVKLNRSTKEKIATLVSEKNKCPVCVVAHTMMETMASEKERNSKHYTNKLLLPTDDALAMILQYAESLLEEDTGRKKTNKASSSLNEATRAEIALIVLVFNHMNRVVSAIMGEEMSTAMMGVPRFVAKHMENPSFVSALSKWLPGLLGGPFLAHNEAGMTRKALFFEEETEKMASSLVKGLPDHLQGVQLAGRERAICVGRLLEWSKAYEIELLKESRFLSRDLVEVMDRTIAEKAAIEKCDDNGCHHPGKTIGWANACILETDFRSEIEKLADQGAGSWIVVLLLCLSLAPQVVYQSLCWDETVRKLGKERARCLVFWWSLRMTLRDAAGLELSNSKAAQ